MAVPTLLAPLAAVGYLDHRDSTIAPFWRPRLDEGDHLHRAAALRNPPNWWGSLRLDPPYGSESLPNPRSATIATKRGGSGRIPEYPLFADSSGVAKRDSRKTGSRKTGQVRYWKYG